MLEEPFGGFSREGLVVIKMKDIKMKAFKGATKLHCMHSSFMVVIEEITNKKKNEERMKYLSSEHN